MRYHVTLELRLRGCYVTLSPCHVIIALACTDDFRTTDDTLTLAMTTMFDWLNDVIDLRHKAYATSASSNKAVFAFQYASNSFNDA